MTITRLVEKNSQLILTNSNPMYLTISILFNVYYLNDINNVHVV